MKITAIKPHKKNKNLYSIYVDGEYFCSLDYETIYQMHITEGMEIDLDMLKQASEKSAYKKALSYSLNMLAKYYKTRQELIKKLREKEFDEDTITAVIDRLTELGYINDENYAEIFISSKKNTNQGLNKKALYNKLLHKGVDKEIIKQSLDRADIDEFQNAMELAEKKLRNLKGDKRQKKAKLYSFLLYKGFSYEICSKVINNIDITE